MLKLRKHLSWLKAKYKYRNALKKIDDAGLIISRPGSPSILNKEDFKYNYYNEFEHKFKIRENMEKKPVKKWGGAPSSFYNYEASFLDSLSSNFDCSYSEALPQANCYENAIYFPHEKMLYLPDEMDEKKILALENFPEERYPKDKIIVKNILKKVNRNYEEVKTTVIYGGNIFLNHYGHFLIDGVSRLWYALKEQNYPIIIDLPRGIRNKKTHIDYFYEALNIDSRRFISFLKPVKFKKIIVPERSIELGGSNAYEIHKLIPENVAKNIVSEMIKPTDQPLYLSRAKLPEDRRLILNERDVEDKLRDKGYAVIYPEELSLVEQIRLINRHNVVIGPGGSALHNILFNLPSNKQLIYLGDTDWLCMRTLYIDAMKSIRSVYIACLSRPEIKTNKKKESAGRDRRVCDTNTLTEVLKKIDLF